MAAKGWLNGEGGFHDDDNDDGRWIAIFKERMLPSPKFASRPFSCTPCSKHSNRTSDNARMQKGGHVRPGGAAAWDELRRGGAGPGVGVSVVLLPLLFFPP